MTVTEMPPVAEGPAAAAPGAEAAGDKKGKKGKAKKDKGGAKSNLVPAIVLAVGIATGGFFMGSGGGEATVTEVLVTEPVLEPGEVVGVGPLTVNLAGGSYLRVGVSIQASTEAELEVDADGAARLRPADESRLLDQIIAVFGGQDVSTLAGSEGRDGARSELFDTANEMLDGQVLGVYFTEFVMQ